MLMTLGWLIAATERASCRKRALVSSEASTWSGELDGDHRLESRVAGLIDDPHAAFAELFKDLVP